MRLTESAVKTAALALGLSVAQPERIRDAAVVERIRDLEPDLVVVVAYGQIIPASILSIARRGVLNVHASLLPRWRGAAPVAHAILAGDPVTGVTIMRMDEQLDHGPILAQREVSIDRGESAPQLMERLAAVGAELLVETIAELDRLQSRAQDDSAVTIAPRLKREDGELDWSMGAEEIDRRVRAFQPWPGVTLPTKRGRVKVISGHVEGDRYVPDVVQVPGRRPAPAAQVLGDA